MLDTAIQFFTIGASLVAGGVAGVIAIWLVAMLLAVGVIAVVTLIAALFSK